MSKILLKSVAAVATMAVLLGTQLSAEAYYVAQRPAYTPVRPVYHPPAIRQIPSYRPISRTTVPRVRSTFQSRSTHATTKKNVGRGSTPRARIKAAQRSRPQLHRTSAAKPQTNLRHQQAGRGALSHSHVAASSSARNREVGHTHGTATRAPKMTAHRTLLPAGAHHNPSHRVGAWGEKHHHEAFIYQHGGHRWHRWYYRWWVGGVPSWFWYDTLADLDAVSQESDPEAASLPVPQAAAATPASNTATSDTSAGDTASDTSDDDTAKGKPASAADDAALPQCEPNSDTCSEG